jgi:hypothetical protein
VPFPFVFAYIALDCCPKPSFFLHPLTTNHQSLRSFHYNHSFQTFPHSSKASITSVFFHHHNIIHSKCLGTWQPSSTLTSSLAQHHITSHHIINLQQACESPTSAKCLQLWPRSLHGKPPSLSHSCFTDICQKPKNKKQKTLSSSDLLRTFRPRRATLLAHGYTRHCLAGLGQWASTPSLLGSGHHMVREDRASLHAAYHCATHPLQQSCRRLRKKFRTNLTVVEVSLFESSGHTW